MRGTYVDVELPVEMWEGIKQLAKKWYPREKPRRALDRALSRLLNLGIRRVQEDPKAMAAFLRDLDSR